MPYILFCVVIGETTPFPVTIGGTQSVGELKGAIKKKAEPELDAFDAHTLILYRIDVDGPNKHEYISKMQEVFQNPSSNAELGPFDKLRDHYQPPGPPDQMVHILVQPPRGELCIGVKLTVLILSQRQQIPRLNLNNRKISPSCIPNSSFVRDKRERIILESTRSRITTSCPKGMDTLVLLTRSWGS
jgi:Crinkler effector protein N-terminal domain